MSNKSRRTVTAVVKKKPLRRVEVKPVPKPAPKARQLKPPMRREDHLALRFKTIKRRAKKLGLVVNMPIEDNVVTLNDELPDDVG